MEVDEAAPLVFGDFGVGQPDAGAVGSGELVEPAAQGDDGAAPEFGGVGVPDDGGVVVVAVGAQRPAQACVVFFVALSAGDPLAVGAVAGFAAWPAAGDPAVRGGDAGVHGSE